MCFAANTVSGSNKSAFLVPERLPLCLCVCTFAFCVLEGKGAQRCSISDLESGVGGLAFPSGISMA